MWPTNTCFINVRTLHYYSYTFFFVFVLQLHVSQTISVFSVFKNSLLSPGNLSSNSFEIKWIMFRYK